MTRCAGTEPKGIQQILVSDRIQPRGGGCVTEATGETDDAEKKVYMYVFQTVITVSISLS